MRRAVGLHQPGPFATQDQHGGRVFQLEGVNSDFKGTGVALVIGANEVVKRVEGKGYAGIVNALFYGDNCNMVYGDAQAILCAWSRPFTAC